MPPLKEGEAATKKRDECVSKLEGKTNPKTGKPYTKSERYAICTSAVKKAVKHGLDDSAVDLAAELFFDVQEDFDALNGGIKHSEDIKDKVHTMGVVQGDGISVSNSITNENAESTGTMLTDGKNLNYHQPVDINEIDLSGSQWTITTTGTAPTFITSSKSNPPRPDEVGLLCFSGENDWRRHYPGTTHAFFASFARRGVAAGTAKRRSRKIVLENDGRLKQMIFRTGVFVHPWRGVISADNEMLQDMKRNFDLDVLGQDLPVNVHHQNGEGALGFHDELSIDEDTFVTVRSDGKKIAYPGFALNSYIELTDKGYRILIGSGERAAEFLYASAEIYFKLRGQERFKITNKKKDEKDECVEISEENDGKFVVYKNLLVGSAATNVPFIPRMRSFAASADDIKEASNQIRKEYGSLCAARVDLVQELNKRGLF